MKNNTFLKSAKYFLIPSICLFLFMAIIDLDFLAFVKRFIESKSFRILVLCIEIITFIAIFIYFKYKENDDEEQNK